MQKWPISYAAKMLLARISTAKTLMAKYLEAVLSLASKELLSARFSLPLPSYYGKELCD